MRLLANVLLIIVVQIWVLSGGAEGNVQKQMQNNRKQIRGAAETTTTTRAPQQVCEYLDQDAFDSNTICSPQCDLECRFLKRTSKATLTLQYRCTSSRCSCENCYWIWITDFCIPFFFELKPHSIMQFNKLSFTPDIFDNIWFIIAS